jgi:predicted ArsR family transcriptional regulator
MDPDASLAAAAVLADGQRRRIYAFIRRADAPVTRDEVAAAAGMSRKLAAFHLDKLVDAGLLRARYAAPAGRPRGRGRAPKVYEVTGGGIALTIPERRYQIVAEILADAVATDPAQADRAAADLARARGRELAGALPAPARATDVLARLGFEPEVVGDRVVLHNCPFHALATRHTNLVCGLNHALLTGLVEGLAATGAAAVLAPHPGRCCVELTGLTQG